jgi:hypothetical protein
MMISPHTFSFSFSFSLSLSIFVVYICIYLCVRCSASDSGSGSSDVSTNSNNNVTASNTDSWQCSQDEYNAVAYHPLKNDIKQLLLLGMPHSGVVWMRDMLEQMTRRYSGTIGYADGTSNNEYSSLFPYGGNCSARCDVLALEDPTLVQVNVKGTMSFTTRQLERYCRLGGIYTLHTMILMIR